MNIIENKLPCKSVNFGNISIGKVKLVNHHRKMKFMSSWQVNDKSLPTDFGSWK